MTQPLPLRRLIDLPGIDALELKALMKPRAADPDELYDFPEIAEVEVNPFILAEKGKRSVAVDGRLRVEHA